MLQKIGQGVTEMTTQSKSQIRRISLEEVQKLRKGLVFVGARSATAMSRNPVQVPGAIHVPVKELEKWVKHLPRSRTLMTYCA